jgi:hypothetical protein
MANDALKQNAEKNKQTNNKQINSLEHTHKIDNFGLVND